MAVTTTSAAIHITPVVIRTLLKRWKRKVAHLTTQSGSDSEETPQDDIFFDQAFHIVKAFIELGTKNTIESLQAFTNTRVPAPYWAAVSPVSVPLSTCNSAADLLIEWFGPEDLKLVVGGERWWQVRGLDGIDAEWIAELKDIDSGMEIQPIDGKKLSNADANIKRMQNLETVMFYIHGGGYFWGSINTHRYQIIHYAHKMRGRAFAVNYRKAPQYPWPCALQDVLAAYLYLIRPPPGALHDAIPNSKIVFAGDSAGGGLCISVLTILRDLGIPMPAGAVLISPWVDLTHSFPSVMQNMETDIIPKYGFIAKPSTLWPVPTRPEEGGRIVTTVTNDPPKPGNADTLKPSVSRIEGVDVSANHLHDPGDVKTQSELLSIHDSESQVQENVATSHSRANSIDKVLQRRGLEHWEPKPPKIFMENPDARPLELRSQIQMYATTEQLTHPLISPVLQSSLGNLPPLYIIAGDGEVLRDEIIYLAHKAAHPLDYPTRKGVLRDSPRQAENAKKFTAPTKVHLQVFDGMCHVLTVFMFTESARYAYRSIAEFAKHVTQNDEEHILRNPFPELHLAIAPSKSLCVPSVDNKEKSKCKDQPAQSNSDVQQTPSPASRIDMNIYLRNEQMAVLEVDQRLADVVSSGPPRENLASTKLTQEDISGVMMIRERVDVHGTARPMENASELPALQVEVSQVGLLKEAPAQRWRAGQDLWDRRYAKRTEKVIKQQKANQEAAARLLKNAIKHGFIHQTHVESSEMGLSRINHTRMGKVQTDRRWGPLDLEHENVPPTAIAGRRDTQDAVVLLKTSIYYAAPVTHLTIPKSRTIDVLRGTLDPEGRRAKQSPAEEQVPASPVPLHGLAIWNDLLRYFGRKTTTKALRGITTVSKKVGVKK